MTYKVKVVTSVAAFTLFVLGQILLQKCIM